LGYHVQILDSIALAAKMSKSGIEEQGGSMKSLTVTAAKYGFGRLIDLARAGGEA
jgi:hypothetical protein